jgi:hypothetical protein
MVVEVPDCFLQLPQFGHGEEEAACDGVDQQQDTDYFPPGFSHNRRRPAGQFVDEFSREHDRTFPVGQP